MINVLCTMRKGGKQHKPQKYTCSHTCVAGYDKHSLHGDIGRNEPALDIKRVFFDQPLSRLNISNVHYWPFH